MVAVELKVTVEELEATPGPEYMCVVLKLGVVWVEESGVSLV